MLSVLVNLKKKRKMKKKYNVEDKKEGKGKEWLVSPLLKKVY